VIAAQERLHGVSEGANMPTVTEAIDIVLAAKIMLGPATAANAGGVAVSGLETSQNSAKSAAEEAELPSLLLDSMQAIRAAGAEYGRTRGRKFIDYVKGANNAGFVKVTDAMLAYGVG
jgi:glutamate dehydrogenase (NADP+)